MISRAFCATTQCIRSLDVRPRACKNRRTKNGCVPVAARRDGTLNRMLISLVREGSPFFFSVNGTSPSDIELSIYIRATLLSHFVLFTRSCTFII